MFAFHLNLMSPSVELGAVHVNATLDLSSSLMCDVASCENKRIERLEKKYFGFI